ncbi:MAG TPA: PAS domain S-box protein [Methylotenera sp.]|nr:PAS domain S-box protein [Methylotenera sp.]
MSLRFRLNLLITTLLMVFMIAVGYVIIKGMRTSIQEGVEAATRVTTQLLDTVIISSVQNPDWGYTHDVMRRFLESLGHVRSNEIKLFSISGAQLYQSPPSKYRADEKPPQWFVKLLTPNEKPVTRLIRFGRLEIIPNPAGAIREAWSRVINLFWIGLSFFVLLNGMVYWMLGRSLKPLGSMLRAINRVEQGDLATRLPEFSLPEFSRIAHNFNAMAASLQASTAENQRLALIAQQTADAIMIHDLDGNISFWNLAAQRMFGYTPEEIIGQSANLLSPKEWEDDLAQNLQVITAGQSIDNHITQRISKAGKVIDVSISAAPLVEPKTNQVIGDICSMRDITERKRAEEAMRKLEENRQLTHVIQKHIEDERRSLARELHDELGQYVTAIKTFAVAIANKTKANNASPGMSDIESHAGVIVSAANQIYDGMHNIIRQLRPGALDNLGLAETLQDFVSSYQAQNPNIKINLQLEGDLQGLGETVSINLYRIVQESLNNALKYAEASAIDINLTKTKTGALQLNIKDNGIGMDVEAVDQTRHFGLLGMRERAQALHGTFNVDAAANLGTTIYINIPNHQQNQ